MINNLKAFELNDQETSEVNAGFIEPAPTNEELFQKLWGTGTKVEADQPGAFVHDDSVSGSV